MKLCDEVWCVIECSSDGAAFEPEFLRVNGRQRIS